MGCTSCAFFPDSHTESCCGFRDRVENSTPRTGLEESRISAQLSLDLDIFIHDVLPWIGAPRSPLQPYGKMLASCALRATAFSIFCRGSERPGIRGNPAENCWPPARSVPWHLSFFPRKGFEQTLEGKCSPPARCVPRLFCRRSERLGIRRSPKGEMLASSALRSTACSSMFCCGSERPVVRGNPNEK